MGRTDKVKRYSRRGGYVIDFWADIERPWYNNLTASHSQMRGLEVIPERAETIYNNYKYLVNSTVKVKRYSRRGGYVIDFWADIKQPWYNNVTVDIIYYEYLHNEYKRSFVEMHFKWCDLIKNRDFIGDHLRKLGMKCPAPKGHIGISNTTLYFPKFPYVLPFEKSKAEISIRTEPSHDLIVKSNVYLKFKQVPLFKVKM